MYNLPTHIFLPPHTPRAYTSGPKWPKMASYQSRSWEGWGDAEAEAPSWGDPDDEASFDYSAVPADIAGDELMKM